MVFTTEVKRENLKVHPSQDFWSFKNFDGAEKYQIAEVPASVPVIYPPEVVLDATHLGKERVVEPAGTRVQLSSSREKKEVTVQK